MTNDDEKEKEIIVKLPKQSANNLITFLLGLAIGIFAGLDINNANKGR